MLSSLSALGGRSSLDRGPERCCRRMATIQENPGSDFHDRFDFAYNLKRVLNLVSFEKLMAAVG